MAIRLITLDVDGTLLDPAGHVTPRVREAVQRAVSKGCLVTLATGRRFTYAKRAAESLGIRSPLILHGGAVIQDSDTARVLYQDILQWPIYLRVLASAIENGLQPVVFQSPAAGGRILTGPEEHDTEETKRYLESRRTYFRHSYDELRNMDHNLSVSVMGEETPLKKLYEDVASWELCNPLYNPPTAHTALPWLTVDILAYGCCKAKAISFFANSVGIPLSEAMAVGDHTNDIDMIEAVGWGVAMGNAVPEVKAVAKAVVTSNAEDGVAEAIERFVL